MVNSGERDQTALAVLKHSSIGDRGQVMRSSKGKLDKETAVPSFLPDISHCVKVFDRHIFSIANSGMAQ